MQKSQSGGAGLPFKRVTGIYALFILWIAYFSQLPETRSAEAGGGYSYSSEWESDTLDSSGFFAGTTTVWSLDEKKRFVFPWYMPRIYVQISNGLPHVVAWSGTKTYLTNQICLAFFSGTNLLKSYRVSDFLSDEISFAPKISPLLRVVVSSNNNGVVSAERADGYILDFEAASGKQIRKEAKFRSLKFTDWYEAKMQLLKGHSNRVLVVGESFGPAGDPNTFYLMGANDLAAEVGFRQYAIKTERPLPEDFRHGTLCWFVVNRSSRNEGVMVEGGTIRFDRLVSP